MNTSSIIESARAYAVLCHTDQIRKYVDEPYWFHCRDVAMLVDYVGGTDEMIAAAWLHDVVEDTPITLLEIQHNFGDEIAILVEMLTDRSKPEDGNREKRKEIDRKHTACANPKAQTIKLADLISNTSSIVRYDKDFAKVYVNEKKLLLPHLKLGSPILYQMAIKMVVRYEGSR